MKKEIKIVSDQKIGGRYSRLRMREVAQRILLYPDAQCRIQKWQAKQRKKRPIGNFLQ